MDETATRECQDCGHTVTRETLHERNSNREGKVEFNCNECQNYIGVEFHCTKCDSWYGGRISLKPYDNGSVCEYVCPECDGLIRKGPVLDVKQGVHR